VAAPPKSQARKDRIIEAATRIFAQKGFQEATIAEIAQEAQVSEATIYDHFQTKEGLLFAIPLEVTKRLNRWAGAHLRLISGTANRLRATVYLYLDLFEKNPDYAAVALLILKPNARFRETEAYRLIREGFRNTSKTIKEGIASGELRSDLDPYIIRSVIMGVVDHVTTNWLMAGRQGPITDLVDPLISAVMEGILPPAGSGSGTTRTRWNDWKGIREGKPQAG
jgi:TetR/AcrR family fatty acid metabolism transcriptional regulator